MTTTVDVIEITDGDRAGMLAFIPHRGAKRKLCGARYRFTNMAKSCAMSYVLGFLAGQDDDDYNGDPETRTIDCAKVWSPWRRS